MIDFETRDFIAARATAVRDFYAEHKNSLFELALAMSIPAGAVLAVALLEPQTSPALPEGEAVQGKLMPAAEPDHAWTWPIPESEPAATTEETTDEDQAAPRRRRHRHWRRG